MSPQNSTGPVPTIPISFRQRAGVVGMRALMGVFSTVVRLRSKPPAPGPVTTHTYGPDPAETLECIPRKKGSPERNPVVYIHGGGWISGKKELYTGDLFFLADAGYPVFNLEYPMAPENPHPGILISLFRALAWIREHHTDVDRVHFIGDSAGGNLALMLGILCHNPHLIKDFDDTGASQAVLRCQSVVSLYGVLDRLSWVRNAFPGGKLMLHCYGGEAAFQQDVGPDLSITPMDLCFDTFPPSLLIAGTADPLCESTRICAERLNEGSGDSESKIFEGEKHGFFNMSWRPAAQVLRQDMLRFLERRDGSGIAAT
jgi:acetyl esterase